MEWTRRGGPEDSQDCWHVSCGGSPSHHLTRSLGASRVFRSSCLDRCVLRLKSTTQVPRVSGWPARSKWKCPYQKRAAHCGGREVVWQLCLWPQRMHCRLQHEARPATRITKLPDEDPITRTPLFVIINPPFYKVKKTRSCLIHNVRIRRTRMG